MDVPIDVIITVCKAAWDLYMKCSVAKNDFKDMANHCLNIHIAMRRIEHSLSEGNFQDSIAAVGDAGSLNVIVAGRGTSLDVLDQKVKTYNSLSTPRKAVWDRVKFAQEDLNKIRGSLTLHLAALSAFADGVQMSSLARIEDRLQDLVQMIKRGDKEPTILSVHAVEDEDLWDALKAELAADGITLAVLDRHRDTIKEIIRDILRENDADSDTVGPEDSISVVVEIQPHSPRQRNGGVAPLQPSASYADEEDERKRRPAGPDYGSTEPAIGSPRPESAKGLVERRDSEHTEHDAGSRAKKTQQSMQSRQVAKLIEGLEALEPWLGSSPTDNESRASATPSKALHSAALLGDLDVIKSILHLSDDASEVATSLTQSERKLLQISKLYEEDEFGRLALHYAAMGGDDVVFNLLLTTGGSEQLLRKECFDNTCLIIGAALGHAVIVQEICALWHRTNHRSSQHEGFHCYNSLGFTALYVAIVGNHGVITTCLLKHGATLPGKTRDVLYSYATLPSIFDDPMDFGLRPMLLAAFPGRLEALHAALRHGTTFGEPSERSALRMAVWTGNAAAVAALLDHDSEAADDVHVANRLTEDGSLSINPTPDYPLFAYAIASGQDGIIRLLADRGGNVNLRSAIPRDKSPKNLPKAYWTPVEMAVYFKQASAVTLLVRLGANDPTVKEALDLAVYFGNQQVIGALDPSQAYTHVTDSSGRTALVNAVRWSGYSHVLDLINAGSAVDHCDRSGRFAIHYAAKRSQFAPEITRLLLDRGSPLAVKDKNGDTPLSEAACAAVQPRVVKLLIEKGADVHKWNEFKGGILTETLASWCLNDRVDQGHWPEVTRLLVAAGAPLEVRVPQGEYRGKTALQIAQGKKWYEIVKILDAGESRSRLRSIFSLR